MNIPVVVIIATSKRRTSLLLERALPSVFRQQGVNPECIYIVDDNNCEREYEAIVRGAEKVREVYFEEMFPQGIPDDWFRVRVIRNHRTQGHSGSGAWNTGAEAAFRAHNGSSAKYLAILDDDDEWYPSYLSACYRLSQQGKKPAAAVVTSFHRKTVDKAELTRVSADDLTIDSFLIGNPGWQGSNTFIDITVFWQAGGFDESMRSTLDRDLAIRVLEGCELRDLAVVVNQQPLWRHHTDGRDRVTLCSASKRQGLDQFYRKYSARMSAQVFEQSLERASRLFGYLYEPVSREPCMDIQWRSFGNEAPVSLLIGVTSSCARNVREQMLSLTAQINAEPQFSGYCHYVVLTNGVNEDEIQQAVSELTCDLFCTRVITLQEQRQSRFRFPYRDIYASEELHKKSIAHSRTLLQFFCWEMTQREGGPEYVLILDDDLLFETLALQDGQLITQKLDFLGKIAKLGRESTADMLVSAYSDAPALPFYSSIRTQLLDTYYSLHEFLGCNAAGSTGNSHCYQLSVLSTRDDYYYDLSSSRSDHLESPVLWQNANTPGHAVSLGDLLADIAHLNNEANITRPLLATHQQWAELNGQPSFRRGGIALYRNLGLLVDVPNLAPLMSITGSGGHSRRSDFISAIYMTEIAGKSVELVSLPLRHHRRQQNKPCDLSAMKLANDIIGLCFYRVFREFCRNPEIAGDTLRGSFSDLVDHYLVLMSLNNLRAEQLVMLIENLLVSADLSNMGSDPVVAGHIRRARLDMAQFRREHLTEQFASQVGEIRTVIESFDVFEQIVRIYGIFKDRSGHKWNLCDKAEALSQLCGYDDSMILQDTCFTGTDI
ncbi:glycosyltransferase family 2 protein [Thalassolituus marinus]|uniref:Glycosyltransferase n=1 Tax=Thalassolituus marinus TaxID=671053 RepID=A0ABS7ZMC9_9GAMM|nr:glycosyltransferase [Thalassolituus marinus]MCA6062869.1 glycosyltransferase [Thalassolituus marinus]